MEERDPNLPEALGKRVDAPETQPVDDPQTAEENEDTAEETVSGQFADQSDRLRHPFDEGSDNR